MRKAVSKQLSARSLVLVRTKGASAEREESYTSRLVVRKRNEVRTEYFFEYW